MGDITSLPHILIGATLAVLVLAGVFYAAVHLRKALRLRRLMRGWTLPDETDGTLRPILFERVNLDDRGR